MTLITTLKDKLIRTVARSFLLRALDGYKTQIMRAVQGIGMILTGLFLVGGEADANLGTHVTPALDWINAHWLLILNFLTQFGLEFALQDRAAKEKGVEPIKPKLP